MVKTNVAEIKAHLSEYLDRALAGERIVICRHNTPIVELRPVDEMRMEPRPIGPLPGRPAFDVPPSFFEPLADDELDAWEGLGTAVLPARPATAAPRVAEDKVPYGEATKRTTRRTRR